jgi:amino acid transporter
VGIFYAPADLARAAPGLASILAIGASGLALFPAALVFAALARRFDVDGGPVVYAHAAFGEAAGFVVGWLAYLSAVASTAAVTSGLAVSLAPALGLSGASVRLFAFGLASALALLAAAGLVVSARAWTAFTVLKLLPLLALVLASLVTAAPPRATDAAAAQGSLLAAALRVVFAYQGFEIVPVLAGRARSPASTVPGATLASLAVAALLYVLLQRAAVLALPGLASSNAPLAEAAGVYGGDALGRLVAAGTTLSALAIAFGYTATTPHYLSALARQTGLGRGLDALSAGGVPLRALAATWAVVGLLTLWHTLGQLFDLAGVAVLAQYVATAAALLALARRGERGLGRRDAWPAAPTIALGLALASAATVREWAVAAAAVALGLGLRATRRSRPAPSPPS